MAAFNKYFTFIDELAGSGHDLTGSPTLKAALTNTAPTQATDTVWNTTVAPAPAAAFNYTAGGNALTSTGATTTGTFKLTITDSVFTASGGAIGPFRYVILYNTASSPANKVIGYYDYASSITLADTETFTVDFDGTNGVLTLA